MADFEPPSFSLGLDCDLLHSEPETQISSVSEDDDYETLIVVDSEPEYLDPHPKLKRLRRVLTADIRTTSLSTSSAKPKAELNSSLVVDDEDDRVFCLQDNRVTDQELHTQNRALCTSLNLPNTPRAVTNQSGKKSQTVSQRRRLLLTVSDSDSDDPSVTNNRKSNGLDSVDLTTIDLQSEDFRPEKSSLNLDDDDSLPPALRYFFHDDQRIQELVQNRLPNFSPLCNMLNRDLEQPSTSEIDYMGQFSSKQAGRNIKDNKSSSSRKISRKEKIEETSQSQGWVNPKLCVNNEITKGDARRKVNANPKTVGYWVTGADGKRVYVGKKGQELTGRVAYMQYKKESGSGFKKAKRKFATKKKK